MSAWTIRTEPESRTPPGTPPGLLAHNRQTRLQRDLADPPPLLSLAQNTALPQIVRGPQPLPEQLRPRTFTRTESHSSLWASVSSVV